VAAMNLPRVQHLQLVQDVRAVQQRIELSFKTFPQDANQAKKEKPEVEPEE